ncbi:NHL repeat containing protein [Chloroherpeton thalassium ATCC 35110]|uniref:NHL repeat containing protein n=1 Tax=Chloroherpeton thalassium (strain ATCC 35110 / GB-78) TaxID=517418 RepID=B3QTX7_CHLT3|nr:NHL repeat-containing protein [Chloroherpeton thalassium]ACF14325.1 NHL repeat containing protein [Chloroherpeton thalassium ATCC 35110]
MQVFPYFFALILWLICPAGNAAGQMPVQKLSGFENAVAISASTALGEIFVLDAEQAKIFKYDKSLKPAGFAGGYGIDKEAFDTPTDLSASDGVNIYVTDRGNQRVVQYDRWLNFISALPELPLSTTSSSSESSSFKISSDIWRPISLSVSAQGELFILEETSRQVIKINPYNFPKTAFERNSLLRFGGFNSGRGNLIDPYQVEVSRSGMVFVADRGRKCVMIYDQFGNFINRIGGDELEALHGIGTTEVLSQNQRKDILLVANGKKVSVFEAGPKSNFQLETEIETEPLLNEPIPVVTDVAVVQGNLFVLTPKALFVVKYESAIRH